MDEQDIQEFTLEDILKEFGSQPPEEAEETTPAQAEESPVGDPETPPVQASEEPEPATDTPSEPAPATQATIRLDPAQMPRGQVRDAEPIQEEAPVQAASEETEPFSDSWQPEFEQPIADYVPPPPIIFHPRSRLRELKRKLVEGPERRYYELSEKGLGKLHVAIFLSFLVVLLSAGATVLYAMGMVQENRLRLMVFGQFLAMLVSALLGSFQLIEGVTDLIHKRFTLNTLLVCTFIACCADGIIGLKQLRIPCCAAFSLEVTMSLWSAAQRRNIELGQTDTMRKANRLNGIFPATEYFQSKKALLRGDGQVEDFTETYTAPSQPEKVMSVYAIVALVVSLAIGAFAGVLHGPAAFAQVTAVCLLAALPATAFITLSRPMAILERRLHALGSVLCGWQGVEGLSGKVLFPLDHTDLFPIGAMKMNGVKFYGSRDPDEVIAFCTALITANGGGLEPLFTHLLDSRNGRHYDVENFRTYASGGLGGEVGGEPVLVGTLSFLRDMGVDIPDGTHVSQAVYAAIDGELCGLFAITYDKVNASAAGLGTLCGYRRLNPVLLGSDFMLTLPFLRNKFGVNPRRILIPVPEEQRELAAKRPEPDTRAYALTTKEGLAPCAFVVTGARSVRAASRMGVAIHMIGGILGLAMMLLLTILGALELLTPANMFLYELVWMIPGLLITEWTRSV